MAETTPTWAQTIIAALTSVAGSSVSHSERLKSERYIVWQEDGAKDLAANNRHAEKVMTGSADLYTKQEFDPWAEAVGEAFNDYGVAWSLQLAEYEGEDTGFYHWSWDWEAM